MLNILTVHKISPKWVVPTPKLPFWDEFFFDEKDIDNFSISKNWRRRNSETGRNKCRHLPLRLNSVEREIAINILQFQLIHFSFLSVAFLLLVIAADVTG